MADERNILIDLNNSLYAHEFESGQQVHLENLEKAIEIIKNQVKSVVLNDETDVFLNHVYRTIGVFGDRGSGKTSFMISLLNMCKNKLENVEVLRMIDPTLVEHKKPIVLCVIAMIQQKVESVLQRKECNTTGYAYLQRREWDKLMEKISRGIFAIDKVGKDYDDSLWQDEAYVMHTGLAKVNDANEFEVNLREMIKFALTILKKKAFILAFDDIDVDIEQGWNVLESLRRYLSDTRIISIVSGNIKLYGTLVRFELCGNKKIFDEANQEAVINELESQYMLKLLNPSNRINLLSLGQLSHKPEYIVNVKTGNGDEKELRESYQSVLEGFGIIDIPSQNIFKDFLMSMSLRSQIHFLKDACVENRKTPPLDVFTSRLYAYGIDLGALNSNIQMINIALLEYLNSNKNLSDCYLLQPSLPDRDANSNLMALTILECWHLRTNPFLAVDYMLRIGFIRNVIQPFEKVDFAVNLCKYAGWNQMMSLKNSIGLTMAYVTGKHLGGLKEHISLFAMKEKAKKAKETQNNALDSILENVTEPFVRMMIMFPFIRITHNKNNESRSYYSLMALLAVVGDILRCTDTKEMIERINDLKLFRSYQIPQDESGFGDDEIIIDYVDSGGAIGKKEISTLAEIMSDWKEAYRDCNLPPYALGRIITRLYASLSNVVVGSVGQMMNIMVANFFNACLIEETRVKISASEQGEINNSNLRADTRYFKDNLMKSVIVKDLSFTKWVMSCPMLNCYLDDETYGKIQEYLTVNFNMDRKDYSVYELLCKINSKGVIESKESVQPSFSGEKTAGWLRTLKMLKANGIDDNMIQEKIIDEENINAVIEFIKGTGLFKTVHKTSVESFRKNYQ